MSGCANGKKNTIICLDYLTFDEAMESATHIVDAVYSGEGDNGKYVFEVGGATKNFDQVANITDSYILADDIEWPVGNKLPLWLAGLLY